MGLGTKSGREKGRRERERGREGVGGGRRVGIEYGRGRKADEKREYIVISYTVKPNINNYALRRSN